MDAFLTLSFFLQLTMKTISMSPMSLSMKFYKLLKWTLTSISKIGKNKLAWIQRAMKKLKTTTLFAQLPPLFSTLTP